MARPSLHVAVAGTKNTATNYNENFDLMMTYCENEAQSAKDYVDSYMPTMTGQSGKFLTTDGTDASWASLDGKADTDLSNITSDAFASVISSAQSSDKATITGWVMPDFSSGVGITTNYSAPKNGWIYVDFAAWSALGVTVYINNVAVYRNVQAHDYTSENTSFIPISKDDVCTFNGGTVKYFPCKGL